MSIQALRVKAAPFGHNAPLELIQYVGKVPKYDEWDLTEEDTKVIYLDAEYDKILPQSWVIIERPIPAEPEDIKFLRFNKLDESQGVGWIVSKIEKVRTVSRASYGITGTVTRLTLNKDWLTQTEVENDGEKRVNISILRGTTVYAESEPVDESRGADRG